MQRARERVAPRLSLPSTSHGESSRGAVRFRDQYGWAVAGSQTFVSETGKRKSAGMTPMMVQVRSSITSLWFSTAGELPNCCCQRE